MEDNRIVELYFARSEEAIEHTAVKYEKYCHTIAYNILGSNADAAECVNDTWLAVWNSIPPHNPNTLAAFCGKITRRIAIDKARANHALKRGSGEINIVLDELSMCIASKDNTEQSMEAVLLEQAINSFILALPKPERRIFVCRYWYMYSIATIAEKFGYSQAKVKTMLHRIRNKLREYLEREDITL